MEIEPQAVPGAEPVPAGTPTARGPGGVSEVDADGGSARVTRRKQVALLITNLVEAVRRGDDETVEVAVLAISRRSRWLAPLALLVGGFAIGVLLGFSAIVVDRWGQFWFAFSLGIMCAVLMFAYVAVPARLLGQRTEQSRRDKLSAAAVGGAVGAVICSPPYALGRIAILMIGSHTFRYLAVLLLIIAIILQTGATSAVKAVKMSAKIVAGMEPEAADAEVFTKA